MREATRLQYKRPFDLVVLITGIVLLLPLLTVLWLLIPLAIWLEDRGPIFFLQRRVGKDGKCFTMLKFRTMVPGDEGGGLPWTQERDSRVTRVGRLLRRLELDEIPQLISILKGDMSLVGPRPLPTGMHEQLTRQEPRFPERLRVPPGVTGVAQIYLPRLCAPRRKLRYDLIYIRRASLWLDFRLILWTILDTLMARWGTGNRRPEVVMETGENTAEEV